jgi:hypothetical protein
MQELKIVSRNTQRSSGHSLKRAPFAALAAVALGCTSSDDPAAGGASAGSEEPQVVENVDTRWAARDAWSVQSQPALEIGSDQRPEFQFHGIRGAVKLADGRIAVGDGGSGQVRVFGTRGEFIASVGRPGAGPEEFRRMTKLVPFTADSLAVFDAGNRRLSVLGPNGAFARVVSMKPVGVGADLVGVLDSGSFVFSAPRPVPPRDGLARDSVLYLLVSRVGATVDTLGVTPGGQLFQRMNGPNVTRLTVPFGPAPVASAGGNSVFVGTTDEYVIRQYRPGRASPRLIRRRVTPQPFSDAHFNEFLENFPQYRSALQEIPRPAHLPVFSYFVADHAGNLWVQDHQAPGADRTPWTVFDREGALLGFVSLPASFRPTDIGSDYMLGVWTNELGVEHVRLYPIQKPPTGS